MFLIGLTLMCVSANYHFLTPYGSLYIAQPRFHANSSTQQHVQYIFLIGLTLRYLAANYHFRTSYGSYIVFPNPMIK